jgi:hypothetical protein
VEDRLLSLGIAPSIQSYFYPSDLDFWAQVELIPPIGMGLAVFSLGALVVIVICGTTFPEVACVLRGVLPVGVKG